MQLARNDILRDTIEFARSYHLAMVHNHAHTAIHTDTVVVLCESGCFTDAEAEGYQRALQDIRIKRW